MTFLDKLTYIQFETGEKCWIQYEDEKYLYLIFADLTAAPRLKSILPSYKIINEGILNE